VAGDAVLLLLGERWQQTIPLVQTLSIISVFSALSYSTAYLLLALGRVSLQALITWVRLALFLFLVVVVFPNDGAQGIANIRLATTALGFMLFIALVLQNVKAIRLRDIVMHVWRPLFSTGIMVLTLGVIPRFDFLALFFQLLISIALGAATYASAIIFLWRVSGAPEGAETYLLEQLRIKDKIFKWGRVPR
jgi:O-antigen/teichoic acid export membrane protein